MRSAVFVAVASFGLTGAAAVQNYTSALDMTIDANTVEPQDRNQWCSDEYDVCRQLCSNDASTNTCEPSDLSYECKCASNSSAPGLQYYANSMPSHICFKLFDQCNQQNVGKAEEQAACISNIQKKCGTQDPTKAVAGSGGDTSSSASPASSTSGAEATGGGGSTSTSSGFAAPTMAPGQGIAAAAAALGALAYIV